MSKKIFKRLPISDSPEVLTLGIDEAGRGPAFGDVVVAGVVFPVKDINSRPFDAHELVRDSKQLTEKQRDLMYDWVIDHALAYSIISIDVETIDRLNILNATILGFNKVIRNISQRIDIKKILIDGNRFKIFPDINPDLQIPVETVIKGDSTFSSIAGASILAKVTRDRDIVALSKDPKYKGYDLENNKGYLTPKHKSAILELGLTDLHRKSFKLI